MHYLELNSVDSTSLDRIIVIAITFVTSSLFSTLITLYITRGVRSANISEAVSRYATNITQDAERLLDRLEKTETKLEKTETRLEETRKALDKCLEECKCRNIE